MMKWALVCISLMLAAGCEPDVLETSIGGSTVVGSLDQEPLRFDVVAENIENGHELKVVVLGVASPGTSSSAALRVELVAPGEDWEVTPTTLDEVPRGEKFGRVAEAKSWPCDGVTDCALTLVVLFQNDGSSTATVDWTIRVRAEVDEGPASRIVLFRY